MWHVGNVCDLLLVDCRLVHYLVLPLHHTTTNSTMNNNNQRTKKTARKKKMAVAAKKKQILGGKTKEQMQKQVDVTSKTMDSINTLRAICDAAVGPDGNLPLDEAANKDISDGFHSAMKRAQQQWADGLAALSTLSVLENHEELFFDDNSHFDDETDGAGGGMDGGMAV